MEKTIFAPAKINLCLHVLGKRGDGYHDLMMLMQQVSLFDRVHLSLIDEPGIQVVCPGLDLPRGEENIAARAARMVLEAVSWDGGVRIVIDKKIPVAAGLGGGSSDAAAVLLGLNELFRKPFRQEGLVQASARLGADVPFFVLGRSAWATGIGDRLRPINNLPDVWYVLVNPGFAVSTAWVYGNLGLTSPGDVAKLPEFSGSTADLVELLHNDLEQVTQARHPEIGIIKDALTASGALGVLMSGSGATVFGVFPGQAEAEAASAALRKRSEWSVFCVKPVEGAQI